MEEEEEKNQNGRQTKRFKMADDQKNQNEGKKVNQYNLITK